MFDFVTWAAFLYFILRSCVIGFNILISILFDGVQVAITGSFSAPKAVEIVAARGQVLELLKPDDTGKIVTVHSTDVFGKIRSLSPFRFPGSQQDYIIAGSDSGRIVILQYSSEKRAFVKVHQETFGRSGCRRAIAGEYLAVDPKGRACMIAAVEKQKFVYVLNRDNEARLTISSPLEAHKSHHIVYDVVGMDVGFDNPRFAAIELDYGDADADPTGEAAAEAEKLLVVYELDLGLNHVSRVHAEPIDPGANRLVTVPGAADGGPGGVLICCENFVLYRNPGGATGMAEDEELRAVIPRRENLLGHRSVLITAVAVPKIKGRFLAFLQSEYGDIYRTTLDFEGGNVSDLKIKYFDTIPTTTSLCVLRRGFLFAASEFGDHALYAFQSLGDDDETVEASASGLQQVEGDDGGYVPVFFTPRCPVENLELLDRVESLAPITDMKVSNLLNEEVPQIYAGCGRGSGSSLRVLRPGLAVTENAASPLPAVPTGVWTLKKSVTDEYDSYIVVSFANATLVLRILEASVEQADDSGLATNTATIRAQTLADDSILQITSQSLRHIRPDGRVSEWRAPGRRNITRATTNSRQCVIALGEDLLYFELSPQGLLVETEKSELGSDISCIDIGSVPEGRQRSKFLAVGFYDGKVRILSLDPGDDMRTLSTLSTETSIPESVLMLEGAPTTDEDLSASEEGAGALFLQAGLSNGVLLRAEVDPVDGRLTDKRSRFLGVKPPRLTAVMVRGQRSMLALSSRPWLGYYDQGRFNLVPLSCEELDAVAPFTSDQCPEGFVAVARSALRVLTIDRLGTFFNQRRLRLRYTPRKIAIHEDYNVVITIESDAQAIPLKERNRKSSESANGVAGEEAMEIDDTEGDKGLSTRDTSKDGPEANEETAEKEEQLGSLQGHPGQWGSCVRVIDPSNLKTTHCIEMDNGDAAISMAIVPFDASPQGGALVCIGTVKKLQFNPRVDEGGSIRVYKMTADGKKLDLVHITDVGGLPRSMVGFRGRLLVGVGRNLRMYDLGKKRLLRKCEFRGLPTEAATLQAHGSRVYVGDAQESIHFLKYKARENRFYEFADDTIPRHIIAACPLDYDTIAASDRFGNIFILRLPPELSAAVEEDPTAGKFAGDVASNAVIGAPNRLVTEACFHIGETVTSLQRSIMQAGGREVILYATVNGCLGALYPLSSRSDMDFFQHLEMHMRQEAPPLLGRDHMAYRSAYVPVRNVLDGDLCAQYGRLPVDRRVAVGSDLDRSPGEVLKKIEDIANKII